MTTYPTNPDLITLRRLRHELDIRLDSLDTGDPIDPASLDDLATSVGRLASRIAADLIAASAEAVAA